MNGRIRPNNEKYMLFMDGEWSLKDLYSFSQVYTQAYSFLYALDESLPKRDEERYERAFNKYPWQGGYSSVNFYNNLYSNIPYKHRPEIASIQYSSPGWIELYMKVVIGVAIGRLVLAFSRELVALYNEIYKGLQERRLLRIEIKKRETELSETEISFLLESTKKISRLMGIDYDSLIAITEDPLITLKIVLSFYRRIREINNLFNRGKIKFKQ